MHRQRVLRVRPCDGEHGPGNDARRGPREPLHDLFFEDEETISAEQLGWTLIGILLSAVLGQFRKIAVSLLKLVLVACPRLRRALRGLPDIAKLLEDAVHEVESERPDMKETSMTYVSPDEKFNAASHSSSEGFEPRVYAANETDEIPVKEEAKMDLATSPSQGPMPGSRSTTPTPSKARFSGDDSPKESNACPLSCMPSQDDSAWANVDLHLQWLPAVSGPHDRPWCGSESGPAWKWWSGAVLQPGDRHLRVADGAADVAVGAAADDGREPCAVAAAATDVGTDAATAALRADDADGRGSRPGRNIAVGYISMECFGTGNSSSAAAFSTGRSCRGGLSRCSRVGRGRRV